MNDPTRPDRRTFFALALASTIAPLAARASLEGSDSMSTTPPRNGARDFDFLLGRWHAESRRLAEPLSGSDRWETFTSTHDGVAMPSDLGIADDFRIDGRAEPLGLALQLYDRSAHQWKCHWLDNRTGTLTAPLVGRFENGVGTFEGPDTHAGKPIRVRYTWSEITATTVRWEQEFSADGGASWEKNWVMRYTRA